MLAWIFLDTSFFNLCYLRIILHFAECEAFYIGYKKALYWPAFFIFIVWLIFYMHYKELRRVHSQCHFIYYSCVFINVIKEKFQVYSEVCTGFCQRWHRPNAFWHPLKQNGVYYWLQEWCIFSVREVGFSPLKVHPTIQK